MPSFKSIFICLLAAASVLAAPVSENALEARGKSKPSVCGVKFEIKDIRDKCPLDSVFTLKDKSTIVKETKTKVRSCGQTEYGRRIAEFPAERRFERLAARYVYACHLPPVD